MLRLLFSFLQRCFQQKPHKTPSKSPLQLTPYNLQLLALALLLFSACDRNTPEPPTPGPGGQDSVQVVPSDTLVCPIPRLEDLTLHEKVGQLFNIRLETLFNGTSNVQVLSNTMRKHFADYPAGGFTLFAGNLSGPSQLKELTEDLHSLPARPMLCIDEEGGAVARIGNNSKFPVTRIGNMYSIGQTGNPENAYEAGSTIGAYLHEYGLDVDFAPVADVWTNPKNTVIGTRSFSSNPNVVAQMTGRFADGLKEHGVVGCYKHFPGHGDTQTDSHYGYAETFKTWTEMLACEMIPFKDGIDHEVPMIMSAHVSAPNVTATSTPATLSYEMLTLRLRHELGFQGIIITDGMEMGAITRQHSAAEAAILALQAGADIILLPGDYYNTYDAVEKAVRDGALSEERINESVARILALKRTIWQAGLPTANSDEKSM